MSDKLSDLDIVNLYHQEAKEQPDDKLDKQILLLAQQNIARDKVQPVKKRRIYQTWYGQLSTAASLVFVAVLYFQHSQSYHELPEHVLKNKVSDQKMKVDSKQVVNELEQSKPQAYDQIKRKAGQLSDAVVLGNFQGTEKNMQEAEPSTPSNLIMMDQIEIQSDSLQSFELMKRDKNEIIHRVALFKDVDALLLIGENEKATQSLKTLLDKYPELKADLDLRYRKLLKGK